ncbi:MAG: GNAT family N-acetyltransferase [Candidatus Thorarchaeota archaeon]|jgi:ribosomal protein S18 acetylase RimI-like enzyme
MKLRIVPFEVNTHKAQFFELNVEFVTWSHEQILEHHKVDMSGGAGGSSREYVESTIDDLSSLSPPAGFVFVLETGETLAGMIVAKTIEKGVGEIKRMYIRPKYRGKGYGRKMLETLLKKAQELCYSTLRLETADFMPAALKIYRSMGFKERGEYLGGEVPEWYRPYCIFMEKVL